jgi:hypothetical protein
MGECHAVGGARQHTGPPQGLTQGHPQQLHSLGPLDNRTREDPRREREAEHGKQRSAMGQVHPDRLDGKHDRKCDP